MGIFRSESYKKGIILSTGFNLFAKLIAFANSIVIAFYFGTQSKTDIYFYALATIGLLIAFVTTLDNSVLIPESIRIREQENQKKSQQFLTFFLYLYLAIGLFAITALSINPVHAFSAISKFDKSSLSANIELLYWIVPLCVLMLITTFLTDILASYKYFTMPMVAASINSTLSFFFVVFFHNTLDVRSIVLGITLGYLINIALLLTIMIRQLNWNFSYKRVTLGKKLLQNICFAQAGNITSVLASYVPLYLLSGFNAGIITALNYGRNVSDIPNQMISAQFSTVSGIKFNELYARKDYNNLNAVFLKTAKVLIFIIAMVSGIFFIFSREIITILFKRGAFNTASVAQASVFLKYFGLSLPLIAIDSIVARLNMAGQKIKEAFWFQILFNIIFIVAIIVFIKIYGIVGYPIAFLLKYVLTVISVYYLYKNIFPEIVYKNILYAGLKIVLLNIFIVVLIGLAHQILPKGTLFFIALSAIYVIIVLCANYFLKLVDINYTNILLTFKRPLK
jgi:peptidoglycan biosynthesis protein MviN/MurJ (putative lipid II flippase)